MRNAGIETTPPAGSGSVLPRLFGRYSVVVLAVAAIALSCNGGNEAATPTAPDGCSETATPTAADGGDNETATPATPDAAANLFLNPGLEDGTDPWFSLKPDEGPFSRSDAFAHSGKYSAKFEMRDPSAATGAKVYYLVQEIAPKEFPEFLSGNYRVEKWQKGTTRQYLQFVVIAFAVDNLPGGYPNHQIRYPLAGIDSPPFAINNAHFKFIGKDQPALGEWVHFEANVKEDFERLWGAAPEGFDKLRILFEVRWDDKTPGNAAEADVYYDDLYFGPAP